MKTGDIILLKGISFISSLMATFTSSKYSHCGILLMRDNIPYIAHSTLHIIVKNYYDDFFNLSHSHNKYDGVVINKLEEIIPFYDVLDIYSINVTISNDDFFTHYKKYCDKKYERNLAELIKAGLEPYTNNPIFENIQFLHNYRNSTYLFCSEFVAEMYIDLNIINSNKPSNQYLPIDFLILTNFIPIFSIPKKTLFERIMVNLYINIYSIGPS
jgi:hypothetical protein